MSRGYSCGHCHAVWQRTGETNCWSAKEGGGPEKPPYCPTVKNSELIKETQALYTKDDVDAKMASAAGRVEGLCYQPIPGSLAVRARWTRLEDTIAFAKIMEYEKIGIATCIGLLEETHSLSKILAAQGFIPMSVCCKTGSLDKEKAGLGEEDKVRPGTFEPACNPVAQARLLNEAKSDMNIIVGLCVGHDMLFQKHSDAPVTTLVVKDRVLAHNPVGALYGQNFYYKRLQSQPVELKR